MNLRYNLSIDTHIKKGILDNKINYYIYNNNIHSKLLLGLAIKAGSVLDEKNKKGTAHFTEHMCLWDENDYCGIDIISKGYTNYNETIFMFECNKSYESIIKCINMLKEIINGQIIKKNKNQIEKVRKEILLELEKENKKLDFKLRKKILPIILNNSLYSKSIPIGDINDIMNLDYNSIVDFHNKWYKLEFMSLIVVGDFQKIDIDKIIKDNLNGFSDNSNKVKKKNFDILDYEKRKIAVNVIKDLECPQIHIYFMNKIKSIKTVHNYQQELIQYISFNIIKSCLKNMFSNTNIDLKDIVCTKDKFSKEYEFSVITLTVKNKVQVSLELLLNKLIQLQNSGFSDDEFNVYKECFIQNLIMNYSECSNSDLNTLFQECLNDFLYDEPILALDYEYELNLKLINEIALKDINNYIKILLNKKNRSLIINVSQSEKNLNSRNIPNNLKCFLERG